MKAVMSHIPRLIWVFSRLKWCLSKINKSKTDHKTQLSVCRLTGCRWTNVVSGRQRRCHEKQLESTSVSDTARFTSKWLGRVLTNLKPGILLSLHTTPTSSLCLQSETPIPLEGHSARVFSLPVQWRLSNQMGPDETRQKCITASVVEDIFLLVVETTKEI